MKLICQVLDAAYQGCNTSEDIAEELEIGVNRASAYTSKLIELGLLRRTGRRATNKFGWKVLLVFEPVGSGSEEAAFHD